MSIPRSYKDGAKHYNTLQLRERVILCFLALTFIYGIWYFLWGLSLDNDIAIAEKKRTSLVQLSETLMSQYTNTQQQDTVQDDIAFIDKRISAIKEKTHNIDQEIAEFNRDTIAIGEIVLLLRDILSANDRLSLESLRVFPAEKLQQENITDKNIQDVFEKNTISLKLKGDYANVFDYLKKIEAMQWSVFWEDVRYVVDTYPQAIVEIQLYTLSIIEDAANET